MDLIIGMLGALLGVGLFVCGYFFGKTQTAPVVKQISDEEKKAIEDERRVLIEDQKAFKDLLNYNVNTAYGITDSPFKT